ncbi:hypothetical protein NFI96_000883 [Prochilodus magdalenae]|nr:hypothetical protein NFI96_000883 [Prochilodus magdalenae]
MAALRPEPEKGADSQLVHRVLSGDRREEGELQPSASGAAEPESQPRSGGSAGVKASRGGLCSATSVLNSSLHTSSAQPALSSEPRDSGRAGSVSPGEAAQKLRDASKRNQSELVWSDTDEDCDLTPRNKSDTASTGHEPSQVGKDGQPAEDAEDAENTVEHKRSLAQDEEEEFTDVSVEMDCDDEEKEGDELKGDETPEEEEGEPEGGEEGREEEAEEGEEGLGEEEEEEEEEEGHETDAALKQKKSSMECRDCGKTFTRRETYNLHRHFHMHQDEQASLTCKECGLTFQHRSSLIKHRTEHKRNGVPRPALASRRRRRRAFKEDLGLDCDHCGDRFASVVRYRLHACQQNLEKPYRCPLCRKEFQYRVSINAHMQSHSLDSPYRCLECNKGFQCAVTLHIHQRSHAALKPYECPDCGMVFRHRSFMEDHRRRHTEERPHQCKICGKSFKYGSLLQQHQYLHTGQKPYRCSECGKRFAFAQNMRAHCRQHKKNPAFAGPVTRITNHDVAPNHHDLGTVGKENTNHEAEKQRNCPLCPRLFYKAADLREHMLIHEAEYEKLSNGKQADQVYACPYCPLKFLDEPTLQSHVLTHQVTSTPLKREVLSIARPGSTENMAEGGEWGDQTEKKPLKCRDCGKCFRYRSVLELHMRIHNKGYQCHICKKSFRFSSYLQQHLIIHSGKKPYKCPDCGKDFAFLQNMKTHQRLHQQKPFRCTQCRKGYSDESQLQRHMLSHSGEKPHKCHLCDKSFGLAYLLRDHLNTHTGERPHRCQECHKSFPWLSSLLVHQKIHARKHQALNQSYATFAVSQRGRTRGIGGRGRRNSRWISSWPRMAGDINRTMSLQQPTYPGQILQEQVLSNMMGQPSVSEADVLEQTRLRSWQVENQARTIQLQQQGQIHIKPLMQQLNDMKQHWQTAPHLKPILPKLDGLQQQQNSAWASKQHLENCTTQDNGVTALAPSMGFSSGPLQVANEHEQKKPQQAPFWASSPTAMPKSPCNADESALDMRMHSPVSKTSNSPDEWSVSSDVIPNTKAELPSVKDRIHFALKTADDSLQASNELDKTNSDQPQGQRPSGRASSSVGPTSDESSGKTWSFRTSVERPKNAPEKPASEIEAQQLHIMQHSSQQQQLQLVLQPPPQMQLLQQPLQQLQQEQLQQQLQLLQQQQFHQSQQQQNQIASAWEGAAQPNQLGTISIQFGAARFAPGPGNTVWGFQATPIVSQALINGPVQQGPGRTQQSPIVSGPQILLNQTSPFISPPLPLPSPLALPASHPLHTVAGQLTGAAAQEEGSLLQTNLESAPLENQEDVVQEQCTGSGNSDKVLNVAKAAEERDARAGGPVPEAPEHEEEGAVNAAVPLIKIKEEQIEENEYITVRLNVAGEDSDEQAESNANLSSVAESTDGDWPFRCEDCSEAFENKEAYLEHRREHTHDGPIVCLDTDSQWDDLLVSTDGGRRTLCCALCGRIFSSSRGFFTHQLKHRSQDFKQQSVSDTGQSFDTQKLFKCRECDKMFTSSDQYLNHQRSHKQASESVFHQLDHLKKKSFPCPTCGRCYSRASALDAHRRCHEIKLVKPRSGETENIPSDTEVTVKTERTTESIAERIDKSQQKLFECLCGKAFRSMSGLATHQRFSTSCSDTRVKVEAKRTFDCSECGKAFVSSVALSCHQRWHKRRAQLLGNGQELKCKECGKHFTSLTFYNKHQRIAHSKEMPAKSFLNQVVHLQKKAFECQDCGLRFSRASALQSHQLCHTEDFNDIMEKSSKTYPVDQTSSPYQNEQGKADCFAVGATVYSQDALEGDDVEKEYSSDAMSGTEVQDVTDNGFEVISITESDSSESDCDSQQGQDPDLELVCESDQEEKEDYSFNLSQETEVAVSQPINPEMNVKIVQIDYENFKGELVSTAQEMDTNLPQETKTYDCPDCGRTFIKAVALRCHMLWHKGGMGKKSRLRRNVGVTPIRRVKCEICGHESFSKAAHYFHLGKHEDRTPYKSITYQLANLQKNSFKCEICGMQFSRLSALHSHQQHHDTKKPYACSQCNKSYANPSGLYNHRRICCGKDDQERKAEHFNPTKTLLGPKVHHCKKCGKGFWSTGAFIHHKQYQQQCADVSMSSSEPSHQSERGRVRRKRRGRKRGIVNRKTAEESKEEHKCDVCGKSYRMLACFLKHQLVHNSTPPAVKSFDYQVEQLKKNSYSCPDCGKLFSRAMALQFHMKCHGYETGFPVEKAKMFHTSELQCQTCLAFFDCLSTLQIHQQHCMKPEAEKQIEGMKRHSMRCQDCGQQFICWEAFKIHLREHMKEDVKLEGECRKRPVVSTVNETNGPHLEKMMRMGNEEEEITVTHEHHTSSFESNCQIKPYEIFIVRSRAMLSEDGESMCSHEKRVYVCSICGKMYACPETFRNHQKLHLNENQKGGEFSCKECGKCFARSAGLAVHMRYHRLNDLDQPTGLRCEQCNRNFHTLHTFTAHQEMHKQGLWCHKCAKGFKSKETLDKHLLGHSTKKHTCHVCQKSFRALSALRHHFHIHTVARTYRCSTCFEAFSQLGNLLSHRKQHLELSKNGRHCRKGSRFEKKRRVSVLKKLAVGGADVMDKHEDSTECPVEDIDEESDEDSPSSSESSESSASTGMSESSDSSADSSTHLSSHSSAHSSAHLSDDSSDDSSADSSTIRQSSPDSSNLSLTDSLADSSADSLADSSTSSLADSLAESSVDFSIDSSVGSSATSSTGEHEEEPTDGEEIEGELSG